MEQNVTEPGHPEPGPDNFSFEDYLEGNSTFPQFEHTAYLDQRSGAELGEVLDEMERLVESQTNVERQIRLRLEKGGNSFIDSVMDDLNEQREAIDRKLEALLARQADLNRKILASAVTLVFQVKTAEELGTVTRESTRQFHKENPQYKGSEESDLDYLTSRSRHMMVAQITHFCTGIKLPDGRELPPPNRKGAEALLARLISSEMMRFMERVGTGLAASHNWAERLDAGFPGGSAVVEEVVVGENRPQVGTPVGPRPVDDVDGGAFGLV